MFALQLTFVSISNCKSTKFRVDESDYFERNGADIYTEAEISVSQAILGGTLRIQGIYEDQMVEVKFNTCKWSGAQPSIHYNFLFC